MLLCQVSSQPKGKEKLEDCGLSPPAPRKVGAVCRGRKEGADEEENLALEPSSQGRPYIPCRGNLVEYLFGDSKQCEARGFLPTEPGGSQTVKTPNISEGVTCFGKQYASVGSGSGWQEICFSQGMAGFVLGSSMS